MKQKTKDTIFMLSMIYLGILFSLIFDFSWEALWIMPIIWILFFIWWWAVKSLFKDYKKFRKSTKEGKKR